MYGVHVHAQFLLLLLDVCDQGQGVGPDLGPFVFESNAAPTFARENNQTILGYLQY